MCMSVKEFLESGKDYDYSKLEKELEKLERFNFFISRARAGTGGGILKGLPVSIKDNICVKGVQTTAGSRILEGYVPPFDSTVSLRIKESGGIIIGKTSQDEFGFGTFSTNCAYGVPKNPWDPERSCGGSSGGAAGLTAALNMPHIAIGQSTGGSISCPASFCGVVGLTPTYGLVSRYGLIDYGNSLDKIGPIGRSVFDVALMLEIIAGRDNRDQTCIGEKEDYTGYIGKDFKGKVGVPKEYFENVDEGVEKVVWDSIKKLEGEGVEYEEVSLPLTDAALYSYYIIATAEASTNLAKFCGMRYGLHEELRGNFNEYFSRVRGKGFGEEAKRRIILGTYGRMAGYRDQYYMKALKVRTKVIQEFRNVFKRVDLIVAPTMPMIAPRFDEIKKLKPLEVYQMDRLTVPPNLAGLPHLSINSGFSKGMPVGLHIIGDHFQEGPIISLASMYESLRGDVKYPEV
ncbi:MAG: Asp-tRNA(Asn)/Glu-tRNA(Gln) amidotransferase subunit GatA [Candidatus Aenigmatarchaeota archaeon]|nr:MAG: Asp-tRNA(Asn)/Glu-tRNA(Gln) amidotransferase subunit GatA [Candidatus Aenigmarchaeota archaeon]